MATATLGGVFAAARRLTAPDPDPNAGADAELLRRFAAAGDEAAFALLVARYGRLVLSACRRIVPDAHLADDAFQATFVVLATKAKTLDGQRPLGPWLYAVACQVSVRARAMIGRRRKRETLTGTVPDAAAGGTGFPASADDIAILDEEIGKLSAAYRDAVVLCELQGLSRRDAAKKLGIAEGTLSSRLAAARKALAARLTARGVVAPAAVVIAAISVPTDLAAAAVAVSTGRIELSTQLLTLVKGGLAMALVAKLKVGAAALAVAVLLFGVGGWANLPGDAFAAPVPKGDPDPGLLWLHHHDSGKLTAYTPDGKKAKELTLKDGRHFLGFTPDGKQILFAGRQGKLAEDGHRAGLNLDGLTLHLRDVNDKTEGTDTGLGYLQSDQLVFSPDGKQIVRQRLDRIGGLGGAQPPKHEFSHILFDVATKKETKIDVPTDCQIMQWTPDGKAWRVLQSNQGTDPKLPNFRWLSYPVAGGKPTPICDGASLMWLDPSPDGKTFLATGHPHPTDHPAMNALMTVDAATGKPHELARFEKVAFVCARWSPDGKRIAAMRYDWDEAAPAAGDTRLVLCDARGKGEKELLRFPDDGQKTRFLGWFPTPAKPADPPKKNAPVPKAGPAPEGVILVGRVSHKEPDRVLEAMDTAGKSLGYVDVGKLLNVRQARVSPDGKKLAFVRFLPLQGNDPNSRGKYYYPEAVYVVDLPLKEPPAEPVIAAALDPTVAWDADGKTLIVSRIADGVDVSQEAIVGVTPKRTTVRLDAATKKEAALKLPDGHAVEDVSPDGKTLLTRIKVWNGGFGPIAYTSFLVPLDTLKAKRLGGEEDGFERARFSPDGTRVAGIRVELTKSKETGLFLADVGTGKVGAVPLPKEMDPNRLNSVAWAPDGKRLAVLWRGTGAGRAGAGGGAPGGARADAFRVTTIDATGENAKTIREFAANEYQYQIEWADPKLDADRPPVPVNPPKKNAPVPKEKEDGAITLLSRGGESAVAVVKPDGTAVSARAAGWDQPYLACPSPDGKRLLWLERAPHAGPVLGVPWLVRWMDAGGKADTAPTVATDAYNRSVAWSPDGKGIYYSRLDGAKHAAPPKRGDRQFFETWRYDLATDTKTRVDLPADQAVLEVSPDGQTLVTRSVVCEADEQRLFLVPLKTLKPVPVGEAVAVVYSPRFSPDGKRLLYSKIADAPAARMKLTVCVLDVATAKETAVAVPEEVAAGGAYHLCWSPDGKRIALHWHAGGAGKGDRAASRVTVCDADGGNARLIARRAPGEDIVGLDWR